MSSMPLVSVIVPTYNRADFLCQAIESVLAQTHTNIELHVVDDGSTDESGKILKSYSTDKRIHTYFQENSGQAVARNLGVQHAKGEYICFLDSDNVWLPDKIERQLEIFERNPSVDVVYGDLITIDEAGEEISRENMRRYSGNITDQLLRDNFVSFNTAMSKADAIRAVGGLNPEQRRADDYDLWLRVSLDHRFLYVAEFFAKYRIQEDQISSNKSARFAANQAIIERLFFANEQRFNRTDQRRTWSHFFCRRARYWSSVGDTKQALRDVGHAIANQPMTGAPWRTILRIIKDVAHAPEG